MQIFISIILIILITGFNALIIKKAKSAAEPAVLFSVLFGAQMVFSLLFLQADIKGVYLGFYWLLAGVSAFALGSYLTTWFRCNKPQSGRSPGIADMQKNYHVYDSRIMNIAIGVLLILSFAQPVSMIYRLGYNISDLFRLHTLLAINSAAAKSRYIMHVSGTSTFTQVFLSLVYLLPLIGGWNFIFSKKSFTKILCLCTVIPSLLVLLTQNTKAAFIGSVLLFLCSFITAKFHKSSAFFKIKARRLLLLIPAAAAFLLLNYVSFFLRAGHISGSLFMAVNNKVLNYLLGQIPAFNHWFSTTSTILPHTFGLKTFHSLTESLGLSKRVPGIYTLKLVTVHLNTNVYTAFRPLIEDFSAFGAIALLLVVGIASGLCFHRIRLGRARCLDIVFITALYFYIFYAFITSPFEYVSYSLAVVLFYVYLIIMRKHVVLNRREPDDTGLDVIAAL